MTKQTVGFIGLGYMGQGMAANLVAKGFPLTVMGHRNRKPVEELVAAGAVEAKTPAELARRSTIIFLCVTGSAQVEEVLNEHPGVADSCVVGLPDERWGELIVAYVVPAADAGEDLTVPTLDAHCRAHPMLADYKRPRAYRLVDSLPMSATGKKMHFRVRESAIADAAVGLLVRP